VRIAIAEDSALLREGIAQLLTAEGHTVILAAESADPLLQFIDVEPPDLVILDVRMPPDFVDEGLRAALHIRRHHPDIGILLLSQYVERRHASSLLDGRGGIGYLLKDRVSDIAGFLEAIERIHRGGTAFDPEVIRQLITAKTRPDTNLTTLTDRERAVLELVAEGHSNASLAATLFISQSGIEKHINTIFTKLDIPQDGTVNRRVLAVLAYLGNDLG